MRHALGAAWSGGRSNASFKMRERAGHRDVGSKRAHCPPATGDEHGTGRRNAANQRRQELALTKEQSSASGLRALESRGSALPQGYARVAGYVVNFDCGLTLNPSAPNDGAALVP